jgi:signal transduction histidine kinase
VIRDAGRTWWEEQRAPGAPVRVWWDWLLTGGLAVTAVLEALLRADVPWRGASLALALGHAVLLLWRRTHPLLVVLLAFGAATVLTVPAAVVGAGPVGLNSSAVLLLLPYSLFRWGAGREMVIGQAVILVAAVTGIAADWTGPGEAAAALVALLFPAALGASVRYRDRAFRREVEQVTLRERGQLARELHDVVAHHVSAIAVRAQAGQLLAATEPDAAVEALRVVEGEASRALAEMRAMVGVLREGLPAELAPQSGLTDIRRLGREEPAPRITVEIGPHLDDLTQPVASALFRIAQESVTNAVRHARDASRVDVDVRKEASGVRIRVRDDGAGAPEGWGTSGYGLVGMNERATLLGGVLRAGPQPDGGWLVDATLPADGRPR